ncbi:MAG: M48 family metalloprotease [Pseudomonadota bacterium]
MANRDGRAQISQRRPWRALTLACALTLPLSSAAVAPKGLPTLGDASSALVSLEVEQKIGRSFLQQVRAGLPLSDDPILKYYADVQLRRLAQYSQVRDGILAVVVIEDPQINAFAAPGGVVGINLGLLLAAEDVHEYASVVAHELAHLSQRHFARGIEAQRAMTIPMLASLAAAIAIGALGGGDAGLAALSASQAASMNSQLRYSRGREQEADRVGLNTLISAGFDPNGMARMFDRMRQAYRFTRTPPEFLLTHPLSDSRISDARGEIANTPLEPSYPDSLDYQAMRARAILRFAESPASALKTFQKRLRDDRKDGGAAYGVAIALSATGEHARALDSIEPFLAAEPNKILFIATKAELLLRAKRHQDAINLLAQQLVLNPNNPPLAMLYAEALSRSGRNAEATSVLKRLSRSHKNDAQVFYELAEIAGKAGDIIEVHRARAEFFAMYGALDRAVKHLEYARGLADPDDFKLGAQIHARIEDFKREKREREDRA